jgi:dTDP-4-amino-4,6-dideoxygalactose transaminase
MTEMQATIGCIQLNKLPDWLAARRRNATNLHALLADTPGLRLPRLPIDIEHAYYRYYAFLEPEQLAPGWSQMRILEEIGLHGVPGSVGGCGELYREQAFIRSDFSAVERLPNAKQLALTSLAFLVHPTLSEIEINRTAEVVCEVMMQATDAH